MITGRAVEELLREQAPRVLAVLVRRYGDFAGCEDAVQEALLAAAEQWPAAGVPANPTGWLVTVAARRWVEQWRSDAARRRREEIAASRQPPAPDPVPDTDDTLTLRAVGGLSTGEIARAFLVPEATMAQRISRAKQGIKASGAQFSTPPPEELPGRLAAVLHVLYLIFNEGYAATSGAALTRVDLTVEAIRLTRQLHDALPDNGEVTGLLALQLLTDARRPARAQPDGALIPLAEQDRARWDTKAITEGTALIRGALASAPVGPYQLQAAIAALHDEAASYQDTDWPQILTLYQLLESLAPGPMITLNRIIADAMVHGPAAGLQELAAAEADPALADHHRTHAVRAHLLDEAGDTDAARDEYQLAARRTLSIPEQRYLQERAAGLPQ